MSSIMRWRNGLMGLSVMAITPVSHEVSEPHDLETGRAILLIPTSNPPRARSRWGVYRESGLVLGGRAVTRRRHLNGREAPMLAVAKAAPRKRTPAKIWLSPCPRSFSRTHRRHVLDAAEHRSSTIA